MLFCSNFPLVEPVEDQVVGLFALELRSHVASAVDGCKCEAALVRLQVTGNLLVDHVRMPVLFDVPAECGDPLLRADSGDCAVHVT